MGDEHACCAAQFVCDVADYLKCVICQSVLHKPQQNMVCGHRYCNNCFESLKQHNKDGQLTCPIDRGIIDLNKVFQDTGIKRVIDGLEVRCCCSELGCMWTGEFVDFTVHQESCKSHMAKLSTLSHHQASDVNAKAIEAVLMRMDRMESMMMEKDKEILHLKYSLNEFKSQFGKKDNEKISDIEVLKKELQSYQHSSVDFKNLMKRENEVLMLRNELLRKDVSSLENQLKETAQSLNTKMLLIENRLEEAVTMTRGGNKEIKDLMDSVENNNVGVAEKISVLQNEVNEMRVCLEKMKQELGTEANSIKKNINESLINFESIEKTIKEVDLKSIQQKLEKTDKFMDDIELQLSTIENVLYPYEAGGPKLVKVQWRIHDFENLLNKEKEIFSPMYTPQIKGYCFKIKIKLLNEEGDLQLFIETYRAIGHIGELGLFTCVPTFEIIGEGESLKKSFKNLSKLKEGCTITTGNEKGSWGFTRFITLGKLKEFTTGPLTVRCTLRPE